MADSYVHALEGVASLAPDAGDASPTARGELEELGNPDEPTPLPNSNRGDYVRPRRAHRDGSAPHVIFVTAQSAARAVRSKKVRVVQSHGVPGVVLLGISPLQTGLEDGDVVTVIEGELTPDVDAAAAAITRVLGHGAKTVHGSLVRRGETYAVRVEIPDSAGP
ncbi:MAG: hypothetical protein ABIP39_04865 [Polyangiaceae bacterium]